jgi:hypothetical protein
VTCCFRCLLSLPSRLRPSQLSQPSHSGVLPYSAGAVPGSGKRPVPQPRPAYPSYHGRAAFATGCSLLSEIPTGSSQGVYQSLSTTMLVGDLTYIDQSIAMRATCAGWLTCAGDLCFVHVACFLGPFDRCVCAALVACCIADRPGRCLIPRQAGTSMDLCWPQATIRSATQCCSW